MSNTSPRTARRPRRHGPKACSVASKACWNSLSSVGSVLFLTSPIPFALRQQPQPLGDSPLGLGVALWFLCDDSVQLHAHLKAHDVALLDEPTPGPFGLTFRFRDPDGYVITVHDKA
jgi:hypothetical protein